MKPWIISQNFKKLLFRVENVFIEGITEHDSKHDQNIWSIFNMKYLGKYHNLYSK